MILQNCLSKKTKKSKIEEFGKITSKKNIPMGCTTGVIFGRIGEMGMKKYPPKRPNNANGVCYTDKLCDIKKDCSKCKNLNPNGTLADLKSDERKAIGSWLK